MIHQHDKVHNSADYFLLFFFFFLTITRSGRLAEIRWYVCISKSKRILCVLFSRTDSVVCIYYLFVWSNLNFLHNSQWITLPIQSCLVLYSFEIRVAILSVIQLWNSQYKRYVLSVQRQQYGLILGRNLPLLIYALVISDWLISCSYKKASL